MGSTSPPAVGKLTINLWIPGWFRCGSAGKETAIWRNGGYGGYAKSGAKKEGDVGPPLFRLDWPVRLPIEEERGISVVIFSKTPPSVMSALLH